MTLSKYIATSRSCRRALATSHPSHLRPRRKHHAHIPRITVSHHMPLVSTEDLIWPIAMARHSEVKDVIRRARIETRVPPHLGIQTIFLFFLGFDHLLDQTLDLGIFNPFGLIGKILGHDQFDLRIIQSQTGSKELKRVYLNILPNSAFGCPTHDLHGFSHDVLGADGTVETITGPTIHPVWSVDRQEWVPLAELAQGEGLCCDTESLGLGFHSSLPPQASGLVLSVSLSRVTQPVYNIEVHGEHVYQVGELGLVVHNAEPCLVRFGQEIESVSKLASDAARAVRNGFPHGVSTKLVERISGSDKLHKYATLAEVEAAFVVEQTGSKLTHYTVHLPDPVTDEVASLFNLIFRPK